MADIHQVEVVIHVDEALTEGQRTALVSNLIGQDGVEDARFTIGRDHLMVIDYDSNKLHSLDILGYVKHEYVNAELIGI
jgi:hypothetical protein